MKSTYGLVTLLLCLFSGAAIAATLSPVQKEIATAKIHATVAAHAKSLDAAHLHLQHVINCMVGRNGEGYSAAAEALAAVPCKNLGNGALQDSSEYPALHALMRDTLKEARAGTEARALPAAKQDADKTLALLNRAEKTR